MKYLFLFTFLVGCGYINEQQFKIDSELKPYYMSYLQEAKLRNRDLTPKYLVIKFTDSIDNMVLGFCSIQTDKSNIFTTTPTIIIDRSKWNKATELDKYTLMFHELHHCIGGYIGHDDSVDEDGYPKSLMNTYAVSVSYPLHTKNNWENYLNELFSK
jgi:hypothetical protein